MKTYKTIVLGATTNPNRYAYRAVEMLRQKNIEVIPIGIRKGNTEALKFTMTCHPLTTYILSHFISMQQPKKNIMIIF